MKNLLSTQPIQRHTDQKVNAIWRTALYLAKHAYGPRHQPQQEQWEAFLSSSECSLLLLEKRASPVVMVSVRVQILAQIERLFLTCRIIFIPSGVMKLAHLRAH